MNRADAEYLPLLIAELDNPILVTNPNFEIEWVNPGFVKTYGYTLEEFVRLRGKSLFTASYNSNISRALNRAIKQRVVVKYESRNVTKDGRELWISSTVKPVFDEKGHLSKILIIDLNVQEKKQMENRLELTDTILQSVGSLVLVADSKGEIVYVSPSVSKIIGYSSHELLGNGWWELSRKTEWDSEKEKQFVAQCAVGLLPMNPDPYEKKLISKDGTSKWILWKDTKGPGELLIGVGHEITERKKNEEIIYSKNKDITDSIHYAHRIQNAIFPAINKLPNTLCSSFVFFKPRNIVSGDFYWFTETSRRRTEKSTFLIAAADCTGHGVPGALMSIVGTSLLNQLVKEKNITDPARILTLLNKKMKEFLRQTDSESKTRDGMDIGIIAISPTEAIYAGANRPLYLFRNKTLTIYPGNKAAIGGTTDSRHIFTSHKITIEPGDMMYLFTDGYADQFGGIKGKKFLTKRFKQLLENIHSSRIKEQELVLAQVFDKWKADHEQVDDVLVIGMKF
jgi:PAS domain S-box-containing protein